MVGGHPHVLGGTQAGMLSAKVSMSPQHISEIESGKRDPQLSSIERMGAGRMNFSQPQRRLASADFPVTKMITAYCRESDPQYLPEPPRAPAWHETERK